jgi:photosystem II stability/assembly factor-like uncharacterized protein
MCLQVKTNEGSAGSCGWTQSTSIHISEGSIAPLKGEFVQGIAADNVAKVEIRQGGHSTVLPLHPGPSWVPGRLFVGYLPHSSKGSAVALSNDGNVVDSVQLRLADERRAAKQAQHRRITSRQVHNAQLLTPTSGWALSARRLEWTDDAGASWSDITPPGLSSRQRYAVQFLDHQHGWLEASGGGTRAHPVVFSTTDGGHTWTNTRLPAPPGVIAPAWLSFISPQEGWVSVQREGSSAFSFADLFHTTDGGATWERLSIPIAGDLRFYDSDHGWVAGGAAGNQLFSTSDGGRSWQQRSVITPARFRGDSPTYSVPTFFDPSNGVLPVTFGSYHESIPSGEAFFTTSNGGASWTLAATVRSKFPMGGDQPMSAAVLTPSNWLVIQHGGRTVDVIRNGGTNQEELNSDGSAVGVFVLDFVSTQKAWALSQRGGCRAFKSDCWQSWILISTEDGGRSWQRVELP